MCFFEGIRGRGVCQLGTNPVVGRVDDDAVHFHRFDDLDAERAAADVDGIRVHSTAAVQRSLPSWRTENAPSVICLFGWWHNAIPNMRSSLKPLNQNRS